MCSKIGMVRYKTLPVSYLYLTCRCLMWVYEVPLQSTTPRYLLVAAMCVCVCLCVCVCCVDKKVQ